MTRVVAQLRKALGDPAAEPRYIETVPTRGYRFIAPVRLVDASSAAAAPPVPETTPSAPETTPRTGPGRGRTMWLAGALAAAALLALLICVHAGAAAERGHPGPPPHPFTGGPAPGQPDRRPRAGILQRRDDRRAHHQPRVPAGPARDLPAVGHALQGQRQAPAGDRAGAGRGGSRGGLGRPLGRAGAHHRPARPRPHRSPSLGPQLRTPAGGRARAAGRAGARHRRGGPHHGRHEGEPAARRPSAR